MQTLPNGKQFLWKSKDGETRHIPVDPESEDFLRWFKGISQSIVLLSRGRASSGLYNWNTAFDSFTIRQSRSEVFLHAMDTAGLPAIATAGTKRFRMWSLGRVTRFKSSKKLLGEEHRKGCSGRPSGCRLPPALRTNDQ